MTRWPRSTRMRPVIASMARSAVFFVPMAAIPF